MEKIQAFFRVSFSTKVLAPVVATMIALAALTAWTVNRLITQQFQNQAALTLRTAEAVFQGSQEVFKQNLLKRFRNLVKAPQYRAAMQTGDIKTLKQQFQDMPQDQDVDVVLFTSASGQTLVREKRDPAIAIPFAEFERRSGLAVRQALENEESADTIHVGNWLFGVVSIPVLSPAGKLLGALTFGSRIETKEFKDATSSEIVLLADGNVLAATLPGKELNDEYAMLFKASVSGADKSPPLRKVLLKDAHYFCSAGHFRTLNAEDKPGYLLLSSYEEQLRDLQSKQQTLIFESTFAILLGVVVVWY